MDADARSPVRTRGIQASIAMGFAHWLFDNGHLQAPPGDFEDQKDEAVATLVTAYFTDMRGTG